jgi:hypothetical protein
MTPDEARDQLAFLRAIVEPDESWQRGFGQGYFAGGFCYGVQILMHAAQFFGLLPQNGAVGISIGAGPTIVFVAIMIWLNARDRHAPKGGATARAVASVFAGVGLANLALIAILAFSAIRLHNLEVWLIYPCIVMVLQSMAWFVAWTLRRKPWFGIMALGWLVVGLAMGFTIQIIGLYLTVLGLGLFGLMMVPGLVIMRQARAG